MDIKLYYTPRTRAIRVRWLLEELALPYQLAPIDLFHGEGNSESYKAIHPLGCVPAMEVDGEVMIESCAICAWLTDQFPEKCLAPSLNDPLRRDYEQWMYFVPGTLEPPIWDYVLHKFLLPRKQRISAVLPWCLDRYQSVLEVLHARLGSKPYILGDTFTSADILIGSTLMWKTDELERYDNLKQYVNKLAKRETYNNALKPL